MSDIAKLNYGTAKDVADLLSSTDERTVDVLFPALINALYRIHVLEEQMRKTVKAVERDVMD